MRYREWVFLFIIAGCGIALANYVGFKIGFFESIPGGCCKLMIFNH